MTIVALKKTPMSLVSANDNPIAVSSKLPEFQFNHQIRTLPEPAPLAQCESATNSNRSVVPARVAIVKWILEKEQKTGKRKPAIDYLLKLNRNDKLTRILKNNLSRTTKSGKPPSKSTLYEWVAQYVNSGYREQSLQDKHTGRRRKRQDWDLLCLQMYHIPSKPGYHDVAFWLQDEGFDVTGSQVRRFIQSMPASYGPESKWRVGKHYFGLNKGAYVSRDRSTLKVGEVYEGDGHTVDVYVQHPSGVVRPYRIELTAWMDIRSRKIVGWFPSHAESSLTTLFSLSSALIAHDHVPTFVHIDKGSGFKAKMLSDDSVGFYEKMSITPHEAIAGNAKGKGDIEGWFRIFRDKHDKKFAVDYCGHDQAAEINRRITAQIESGKRQLVRLEDYLASVQAFIERYNNTPQKTLGNKSPNEIWGQLDPNPVILKDLATIRPSKTATVRRSEVQIDNRKYAHPVLIEYDGSKLEVEYDIRDDKQVWIYDDRKRLICIAPLKAKKDWLPNDRRQEAELKAQQGRRKRREKQIELDRMEEALITSENNHQYEELHELQSSLPEPEPKAPDVDIDLDIDLNEFD